MGYLFMIYLCDLLIPSRTAGSEPKYNFSVIQWIAVVHIWYYKFVDLVILHSSQEGPVTKTPGVP